MDEKYLVTAGLTTLTAVIQETQGGMEAGSPGGTHNAKMMHNDKTEAGGPGGTHNAKVEDPAD